MAVMYMLCSKKKKARNVEVDERKGKKINMPTIMKIFGEGGGA